MKRYDKISTYLKENILILIPLCITGLLFDGLMSLIPILEGKAINSLLYAKDKILYYVLLFLGLVIFVQINRFFKRFLVRVFGNKIRLRMRKESFKNLLNKPMTYFDNNRTGDILNRLVTDIEDTQEGIRKITTEIFDTFVLLLGYFISMFFLDYKITLLILPFIILSITSSYILKKIVYKANKDYKNYLSINKSLTITMLNNEIAYRGFGCSNNYDELYDESNDILVKKNFKALLFKSSLEPIYYTIALLGLIIVIFIGGNNVMNDVYLIGTLSSFITTYILVSNKAAKVGKLVNAYQAFRVSWQRCKLLMISNAEKKESIETKGEILSVSNLNISYVDFNMKPLNMDFKKNTITAICGKVHCGKSVILKALTGIYDYDGEITLDGIDIKNVNDSIGYVKDSHIFSDTFNNNVSLGRNGDLDKAINDSMANAIKNGYDILSHSNTNLSGGEKARLELARALYTNPKILLLDDPFVSIEPKMALDIFKHLKNYNSIIIIVTNNKDILANCDNILLIDEEYSVGKYDELLNNKNFKNIVEA